MSKYSDMTIEELKDYISSESDNPIDTEEDEDINEYIDDQKNNKQEKKSKSRALPFTVYFGEMDLTSEQEDKRKELAGKFLDEFALILAMITVEEKYNAISELMLKNKLSSDYQQIAFDYSDPDDYELITDYANRYANDFVDTTLKRNGDDWYVSDDRAKYNAENEANTIMNRSEFTQAKKRGFYHKQWITMRDKAVRETHREVDSVVIPIDDYFQVGEARMLYPKDIANAYDNPEETVNCRCVCKFLP